MDPTGGVYDQARKLLFVTVRQLNLVLVYSTVDNSLRATISVDQPQGIDESLDGKKVYVGTLTPNFAVIDPDLLQVIQTVPGPPLSNPNFPGETLFPFTLAALSNGKVLVEATDGESISIAGGIFLWDPASGVFSSVTTPGPSGDLIISRSADRSKVLLGSQGEPSALALYDAATNSVAVSGTIEQGGAAPGVAAVSPNGAQIAFPSGPNLVLYDASFNQTASIPLNFGTIGPPQIAYSLDGKFIYVLANAEGLVGFAVLDATNFSVLGAAPTGMTQLFAVDETGMIFGSADRVVEFADVSSPSDVRLPFPSLFQFTPTLLNPTAPTSVALAGLNFSSTDTYQMFFGPPPSSPNTKPAVNLSVASSMQLQMTAPQGNAPGATNATLARPDGWNEVLPDAVSYGPQILRLTTNAGPASGGTQLAIYGYGFLSPSTTVTVGGNPATVTQVFGPGFISPFPFPMDRITLTTPAGTSGPADVIVTTPFGSTTLPGGFQYLAQAQVFPKIGLNQILYDQSRQKLYMSNTNQNRIEVFSLTSMTFLAPIPTGAEPYGIALTPDASKLAVVSAKNGTVGVINPDTQATVAVYPVITSSDSGSLCQGFAFSITPAGSHGMFVGVDCTALAANGTLHFLDLNTGGLSCDGIPFCDPSGMNIAVPDTSGLYVLASSSDGNKVVIADEGSFPSLVASFDLTDNTATTFPLPFNQSVNPVDATVNADANRLAINFGIYTAQLATVSFLQDIDYLDAGTNSIGVADGEKLNPSGSLLFVPRIAGETTSSNVDVYDVNLGRIRMRINLPDGISETLNCMALDETGSRIFLVTNSGVSILQIAQLPLSIATVTNSTAPVGDQVTIRGSGFKIGATVMFGTVTASSSVVDANTITATVPSLSSGPYRITVKNPDGTQYSIDAAFSVN
jgi:DNA-binding beta-propeller fold protein YncE